MDRTHKYVLFMKVLTPLIALSYLIFIFAPGTRSLGLPYVSLALMGATSFILVPVSLEYLVEVTHPVSPEVTSVLCWGGGQLLGGVFLIIMGELKDPLGTDPKHYPPGNMTRSLIFQAIIACLIAILPQGLGLKTFGLDEDMRGRIQVDATDRARRAAV
jgi:FLVCR family MFS transporter 7